MRRLIMLIALLVLAWPSPGPEVLAQTRYYVAVCSQNDLRQRFASRSEANEAARLHAQQTGHKTGVIKE